jgi:O-antigen ligase
MGKDVTLTGRTGLWSVVVDSIAQRPWLGHGYNAFWLGWEGESARVWAVLPWHAAHAHNGVLDLGLELGLVGIALFTSSLVLAATRATAVIRRTSTMYGLWPLAYVVFIVVVNFSESTILVRNSIFWMLYTVTCVWLVGQRSAKRTAGSRHD